LLLIQHAEIVEFIAEFSKAARDGAKQLKLPSLLGIRCGIWLVH